MKLIILAAFASLFTIAAHADCPSIDKTIARFQIGEVTSLDVEAAILCSYAPCSLKIPILADKLEGTVELFKVGEKTKQDIYAAADEFAKANAACRK